MFYNDIKYTQRITIHIHVLAYHMYMTVYVWLNARVLAGPKVKVTIAIESCWRCQEVSRCEQRLGEKNEFVRMYVTKQNGHKTHKTS